MGWVRWSQITSYNKIFYLYVKTNDIGKKEFLLLFLLHMFIVGELENRDKEKRKCIYNFFYPVITTVHVLGIIFSYAYFFPNATHTMHAVLWLFFNLSKKLRISFNDFDTLNYFVHMNYTNRNFKNVYSMYLLRGNMKLNTLIYIITFFIELWFIESKIHPVCRCTVWEKACNHITITKIKIQSISISSKSSDMLLCQQLTFDPQILTTTNLFSVPIVSAFPACHRVCSFLSLVSFTQQSTVTHVAEVTSILFFLLLSIVPLFWCTTVCWSIYQLHDIWLVSSFWRLWINSR